MIRNILAEHVAQAIEHLRKHGYDPKRESTEYDLVAEGMRFPPKMVLSVANRFANGEELPPRGFYGGSESNDFLRGLGFEIVPKVATSLFQVGQRYSRSDIYALLNVPMDQRGGDWDTGYHTHDGEHFIFANVGVAGRTGHDYRNAFHGDELTWFGRTGSRASHPSIQAMVQPDARVFVFFRDGDREPFTFAGLAHPVRVEDSTPVCVIWGFDKDRQYHPERPPEEVAEHREFLEGATREIRVNVYERDLRAREACIRHYGALCHVCGFDFEARYGEIGRGMIHVHHLRPLAEIGAEYRVDPIVDLRPLCPNCHAVIHRRSPAYSIEDLRNSIRSEP